MAGVVVKRNQAVRFSLDLNNKSKDGAGAPMPLYNVTVVLDIYQGNPLLPFTGLTKGTYEWTISGVVPILNFGANLVQMTLTIGTAFTLGEKDILVTVTYEGRKLAEGFFDAQLDVKEAEAVIGVDITQLVPGVA